ncbi:hypothetical protein OAA06_01590 [bacterium]|nr:hypothetical protein [bacterium]
MKKLYIYLFIFALFASTASATMDENKYAEISINDILIFNKSIRNDSDSIYNDIIKNKELLLSHKESVFGINWAIKDSLDTSNYIFAFMLEGFDEDWNHTDNRTQISYTNLNPGTYKFKLKWAKDGIWNNTPDYLDITIVPPFWQASWIKILAVILLLGVFTFLMKMFSDN